MGELIALGISAMIFQNIILTKFLGICPFLGVSKKTDSAIGMGFSVVFVMIVSSLVSWLLYYFVLVPYEIEYMRTIVFILVISALVQFVEMFIKKISPVMYKLLGIYLPLITTNCAILGVAFTNINEGYNLAEMLTFSVASGIGFTLVIYIFSTIREKLNIAPVPRAFQGIPIALITAALMAIIVMRYSGVM